MSPMPPVSQRKDPRGASPRAPTWGTCPSWYQAPRHTATCLPTRDGGTWGCVPSPPLRTCHPRGTCPKARRGGMEPGGVRPLPLAHMPPCAHAPSAPRAPRANQAHMPPCPLPPPCPTCQPGAHAPSPLAPSPPCPTCQPGAHAPLASSPCPHLAPSPPHVHMPPRPPCPPCPHMPLPPLMAGVGARPLPLCPLPKGHGGACPFAPARASPRTDMHMQGTWIGATRRAPACEGHARAWCVWHLPPGNQTRPNSCVPYADRVYNPPL